MPHRLLTPASALLLKRLAKSRRTPLFHLPPEAARRLYEQAAEVLDFRREPVARVQDLQLPGGDGLPRPARLYSPQEASTPQPLLLYLHGGGFVVGGLETHDATCRQLARRSGAMVMALDYRLAPEHRFPAAVDDTWAALAWLMRGEATGLGVDASRIAVGGDSAGATLAAVAAIHARDQGWPLALQLLITPGTAPQQTSPSHQRFAQGFLIEGQQIAWFFNHYANAQERQDWRFAPLHADDLHGVAPACVILAECDPLVDEGMAYCDRLRMEGVAVELELVRGVTHDFIKLGRAIPEAEPAMALAGRALARALVHMPVSLP